jgi:hypothetical protein
MSAPEPDAPDSYTWATGLVHRIVFSGMLARIVRAVRKE